MTALAETKQPARYAHDVKSHQQVRTRSTNNLLDRSELGPVDTTMMVRRVMLPSPGSAETRRRRNSGSRTLPLREMRAGKTLTG